MSAYPPLPLTGTHHAHYSPLEFERPSPRTPVPRSPLGAVKPYNSDRQRPVSGRVTQRSTSPANRSRLAKIHQTAQLRDLLYTTLQVDGVVSKRDVGRKTGEINHLVEQEVKRISELESVKSLPLPGRFDPGLRPNSPATRLATPDLKHALETSVTNVRSAVQNLPNGGSRSEKVITPPAEPAPPVKRSPRANSSRRLPHVSVLGQMVSIDEVLREKIQAKYHGGVHPSTHLLRALKQLDGRERGVVTIDQFVSLMSQFNLNLKRTTLESLLIALGLDETAIKVHKQVPYHAFVRAIMPMDYSRPGRFVTSIVDRARGPMDEDPGLALVNELLAAQRAAAVGECVDGTTADGFENALRAKLQARVVSGPTELLSQFRLFDKNKKGWITTEEFVKGCAMFNLYPSADVLAEIVSRYFDEHGRISFAVFVTSIIDTFDFPKARLDDPACFSLLAGNLGGDGNTGLWGLLQNAGLTDALPRDELTELCSDESSMVPIAGDELQQLLDSCSVDEEGRIGLRSFGSTLASTMIASGRADAKDKLWGLLNATGLPGMGLPWSHGIEANRTFDKSIKDPSSDAAAAAMFKAGESSDEDSGPDHPVEDPGVLPMWGSLHTVQPIEKIGMKLDPTQVMAAKLAQKTVGPKQYSDLPKMFHKFAHDPTSMDKDEFAAFLQEGLNANLGRDDVEKLVSKMAAAAADGEDENINFRKIAALAHPSDYPKKDGKYEGVLTLTHPADGFSSKPPPWQPRAPHGLTKNSPIDPVQGMLNKAAQKSDGAKSAEGAELQTLLAAFKYFDTANKGTLTPEQIGRVLTRLSLPASRTSQLLETLGESGKDEVNYRSLCKKIMAPSFQRASGFKWLEALSEIAPLPKGIKPQWPSDSEAKSEVSGVRSDKRRYGKRQRIWNKPNTINGDSWMTALREGNMLSPVNQVAALEHRRNTPAVSRHFGGMK